ncbi:DUF4129 domain-containing protein [Pseudomonas typographi]|uniref:DUF4129 domain-containing protein n=1 Tax=Pseudomonas typographi TaxID=2715964 RepID=A0ABR7YX92_9PSED|nr:DUF4129 domain-containing protein [Pseudomonas typographi]
MQLDRARVTIRPRSPWEALDLGCRLAARHRRLLALAWLALTVPVFSLISLLCWNAPTLALLLFWWGKPLYERLALHILAQALFDHPPSIGQALRAWPGLLRRQWLASLTWRRASLMRSFDLPVTQLEGQAGRARQQRLGLLHREDGRAARWLTVVGAYVETCLVLGAVSLLLLMVPRSAGDSWHWAQWLLGPPIPGRLWLQHLANAFYVLVLAVWGPIYVACGFTLYLNRRTHLEAWDIELVLRALCQRLAPLVVLGLLLAFMLTPPPALAADAAPAEQPRVSVSTAHQAIEALLQRPPFENIETRARWHWRRGDPSPAPAAAPAPHAAANPSEGLARAAEILLWAALAGCLAWLGWHHRLRARQWAARLARRRTPPHQALPPLFAQDLAPERLPMDVAGHAEQLWASDPRQALALLYRGLLSRLVHDYKLPLRAADTEAQVLAKVAALQLRGLDDFSQKLTWHWQAIAYGHRVPPAGTCEALCRGWRRLFPLQGASQ